MAYEWIAQVQLKYDQQNGGLISWPMNSWLHLTIGAERYNWYYDDGLNMIFFKSKEDQVRFILQWM